MALPALQLLKARGGRAGAPEGRPPRCTRRCQRVVPLVLSTGSGLAASRRSRPERGSRGSIDRRAGLAWLRSARSRWAARAALAAAAA
eukprot:7379403-Prymnesium_polylepis.1